MQNRFIFRCFGNENSHFLQGMNELYSFECSSDDYFGNLRGSFGWTSLIAKSDLIIMQCTGLRDKNYKLIFEGDILQVAKNHLFNVIPENKKFVVVFSQYQWWLKDGNGHYPLRDFSYRSNQNIEIIGNIYQNAELLKG